ncbi:MAG: CapA family protein [Muribaculaceae bacterium]|nr:CapA family protein [Muribaculaceae bacterium]
MQLLLSLLFSWLPLLSWNSDVEIVFAGDAMQHKAQIEAARRADGNYSYDECFRLISPYISNADYAVVNLETPLGGKPYTGYPCFSAPDPYSEALADAGFDLMLTANNHTLDRRDKGLTRTLDSLDAQHISHTGTYRNKAERDSVMPFIADIKGIKVAFLNYTYGTNGIPVQGKVVVDYIDKKQIETDVTKAREKGAEIIAVCIHWGNEYQMLPHSSQKSLASFLCDLGVDLIIGGHPHVIQPMEIRRSEKYNKDILVVYSLGNFISNMKTRDTRGGALLKVKITRNWLGGVRLGQASYRLVFTIPPSQQVPNFRLIPVESYTTGTWSSHCKAFTKSAETILKKHNINVPRDTTAIPSIGQ